MPTAILKDGRRLDYLPEPIGERAMKRVFFTADRQSVICFYKDQKKEANDRNRMNRLDKILGPYNPTVASKDGGHFRDLFCWPTAITLKPEFGIVTPTYPSNFFFASGNWKGKEKVGKWFSSPKLRSYLPLEERGNLLGYLRLCNRMARAVRKMHMMGLAHSDLSSKNVLLDPPSGSCVIIDIDSLVVPGVFPPDVIGTADYIAPEVLATQHLPPDHPQLKLPSSSTDLHALSVLIYEYLLQRHPLKGPKVHSLASAEEDDRLAMGEKALFIEHRHDTPLERRYRDRLRSVWPAPFRVVPPGLRKGPTQPGEPPPGIRLGGRAGADAGPDDPLRQLSLPRPVVRLPGRAAAEVPAVRLDPPAPPNLSWSSTPHTGQGTISPNGAPWPGSRVRSSTTSAWSAGKGDSCRRGTPTTTCP